MRLEVFLVMQKFFIVSEGVLFIAVSVVKGIIVRNYSSLSRLLCRFCYVPYLVFLTGLVHAASIPAFDPPVVYHPEGKKSRESSQVGVLQATPTEEWLLHKTLDGQHPDGVEQARLWLLNRARQDPAAEGVRLAMSQEPDIADGRAFFNVDTALLQAEFASYMPKPPAAFDRRLYEAARLHSEDLIARDAQDHEGQIDRINAAGFQYSAVRVNVFAFAQSALNAHAAFNIDWGGPDGGVQEGRGHRTALMSLVEDLSNVGIAAVPDDNPDTKVGPLVMSDDFAQPIVNEMDHFNRFIVGTVWTDRNANDRYDPGEGFAGVTVTPNQGQYFAVTSAGGGYAIPITAPGDYEVTFSGGNIGPETRQMVRVDDTSVLLDYRADAPDEACAIPADLPLAIPDETPTGATSMLVVPEDVTITDIKVRVQIDHTWIGDLEIALRSPTGTLVRLLDRPGVPASPFGCSDHNMQVVFDDTADLDLETLCAGNTPWYEGSARPIQPLADLDGQSALGPWELIVTDHAQGDTGTLTAWELLLQPSLTCRPQQ